MYRSNWKQPYILEHLLSDNRKVISVLRVLKALKLKIKPYQDGKFFDIVKN